VVEREVWVDPKLLKEIIDISAAGFLFFIFCASICMCLYMSLRTNDRDVNHINQRMEFTLAIIAQQKNDEGGDENKGYLDSRQISELIKEIWSEYDINKDGGLNRKEALAFVTQVFDMVGLKVQFSDDEYLEFFNKVDCSGDGKIS